ncbi:MAG: DUF370 domain-containing protein [bacterium]|nr:DUF370 domain-containing protein [bacterium]
MPFLHIGDDVAVPMAAIVAIIDLEAAGGALCTREFIELARAERRLVEVTTGPPRAAVLTAEEVLLSPISAATLAQRAGRRPRGSLE